MPSHRELTVLNGSPRGGSGNTEHLIRVVCDGYRQAGGTVAEPTLYLREEARHAEHVRAFSKAEQILFAFPLYTDAMPGLVKAFIEALEPLCERDANAPIAFLVHSGFPEGTHSRRVERYLERLAERLKQPYLGTIVKGGSEGIRHQTEEQNRSVFERLRTLGADLAKGHPMTPDALAALAAPERFPRWMVPVGHVMLRLRKAHASWDEQLKKNGAYDRRFARPYADDD